MDLLALEALSMLLHLKVVVATVRHMYLFGSYFLLHVAAVWLKQTVL